MVNLGNCIFFLIEHSELVHSPVNILELSLRCLYHTFAWFGAIFVFLN